MGFTLVDLFALQIVKPVGLLLGCNPQDKCQFFLFFIFLLKKAAKLDYQIKNILTIHSIRIHAITKGRGKHPI